MPTTIATDSSVAQCDWERLFYDNDERTRINGVDTLATSGAINALEIINFYHGRCHCMFTDQPTETVMAADANPSNFLISNLIPASDEVVATRYRETPPVIASYTHRFGVVAIELTIEKRLDRTTGRVWNANQDDEHALINVLHQLTDSYVELPYGLPSIPEMIALWCWRELETRALLKGMARIAVTRNDVTAYVTKQTVLYQVKQMLQRDFGRRSIVPASQMSKKPTAVPGSRIITL